MFKAGLLTIGLAAGLLLSTVGNSQEDAKVVLTKNNLVTINGEIDGMSMSNAMVQIAALKTKNVILFIRSPGGSVVAGVQFIQFMKDSGKKFTCVADFAASMAFAIMQACDTRIAMSSSEMMQHQIYFQVEGQASRLSSQYDHTMTMYNDLMVMQANRIGVPLKVFYKHIHDDLWLFGKHIEAYGAVDAIKPVTCSTDLWKGTVKKTQQIMIFNVEFTFSACPLARDPLSYKLTGSGTENQKKDAQNKIASMYANMKKWAIELSQVKE